MVHVHMRDIDALRGFVVACNNVWRIKREGISKQVGHVGQVEPMAFYDAVGPVDEWRCDISSRLLQHIHQL